jgi:membrane protease YdiL (CAAX protease family)
MPAATRRQRALEFAVLFVLLPLVLAWQGETLRRWIIPQLLLFTALCLFLLWRDASFDRRLLLTWPRPWRPCLLRIALLLAIGGAAVLALAHWLPDSEPFLFPEQHPLLWLAVLLLYPLFSALPQELIFRVFLFHRYRPLFQGHHLLPWVSAGVFALAHLVLGNWVALLLSFAGGLLFAYTYARTGSLGLVTLEHGLWGNWLFTVGMGSYFYGGHL